MVVKAAIPGKTEHMRVNQNNSLWRMIDGPSNVSTEYCIPQPLKSHQMGNTPYHKPMHENPPSSTPTHNYSSLTPLLLPSSIHHTPYTPNTSHTPSHYTHTILILHHMLHHTQIHTNTSILPIPAHLSSFTLAVFLRGLSHTLQFGGSPDLL